MKQLALVLGVLIFTNSTLAAPPKLNTSAAEMTDEDYDGESDETPVAEEAPAHNKAKIAPAKDQKNNLRFFTRFMMLGNTGGRIAFERAVSDRIALGIVGTSGFSDHEVHMHGDQVYIDERLVELYAQYYLKQMLEGPFVEGGFGRSFVTFKYGEQRNYKEYWVTHADVGYRFRNEWNGLGVGLATGLENWGGEDLTYNRVSSSGHHERMGTDYRPATHPKLKVDVSLTF